MSQSLSSILIHLVFSTKNCEPFITPAIEPELHPYMAKIFRELTPIAFRAVGAFRPTNCLIVSVVN